MKIQIDGADHESVYRQLLPPSPHEVSDRANLQNWLRSEQAIAGRPLVAGNRVQLLKDGPETFQAMFAAMQAAHHHIHLETFIIDDEEVGRRLADILIERSRAGVTVRMVYDAVGAMNTADEYFARLSDNGVRLYNFHPINPIEDLRIWRINNRHHRKIVVVDGRIGFIGGLNISQAYSSSSLSRNRGVETGWRDTQVKIEGPGVRQLQEIFIHFWSEEMHASTIAGKEYFPPLDEEGEELIRVVTSTAGDAEADIYKVYLTAIEHARERIWITQGYFSPDQRFLTALQQAAQRGVDVRLLLPGMTDSWITINSSRNHYDALLVSGVRIFERKDALQHAKTAVVDDMWSTIGSANLDYRSFLHANEANIVVWGRAFASEMEAAFRDDQAQTHEIRLQEWRKRPWARKVLENIANMFIYWL